MFRMILTLTFTLGTLSAASALEVKLTVSEQAGVARTSEPVSTGVCFKAGEVKDLSKLALFTKSGEAVPCQFLPLVKLEDGSYQWALVDFQCTVDAKGRAEYAVKAGAPAKPPQPVIVTEAGGKYTFKNGVLEFTIDTSAPAFEIFSEMKTNGKAMLSGLGKEAMTCRDALNKNKLYHAGKPTKVEFDYRGPMRTTLMVEGSYVDDAGAKWLGYRVRISCFAGSRLVRVEHVLRNSCPREVRIVKVKDAYLRLGLQGEAVDATTGKHFLSAPGVLVKHRLLSGYFTPGLHDLTVKGGRLVLGVVPTYEGGFDNKTHLGYNKQEDGRPTPGWKGKSGPADYNPGDTGSWWLTDCAYKIDEYWLSFGGGDEALARGLDSRLYALAPCEYYSECEALSSGRFGTLEDEIATYRKWGWKKIEEEKKRLLNNKWMNPKPGYHIHARIIHWDTEADDAAGMLLMALRTGGRGYFDAGLAWARYYTNNFVERRDFPDGAKRGKGRKFNFIGNDYSPIMVRGYHSYHNGRTCGCHFYGEGAMDYYVLTGEKSLLLGCRDLARYVRRNPYWGEKATPGKIRVGSYGTRAFGRQFLAAVRHYEVTRAPEDKDFVRHLARMALKDPSYIKEEDYGFIDAPSSNGMHGKKQVTKWLVKLPRLREYMKKKGLKWDEKSCTVTNLKGESWKVYDAAGSWEQTYLQQAMARYWRVTGKADKAAADYIVRYANYWRKLAWSENCEQVGYIVWGIHFPEKGMCLGTNSGRWMPEHDNCPGPGPEHHGGYTGFGPDVAARAYLVTKDKKYLKQARMYWNRGSKRRYRSKRAFAADDEVGAFACHVPAQEASVLTTGLMFYLMPRVK